MRGTGGAADVDFIAVDGEIERKVGARRLSHALVGHHDGVDVQQPEALCRARRALDALGVGDGAPQHLVAAADAEDAATAAEMGAQVDIPALTAQEVQVSAG